MDQNRKIYLSKVCCLKTNVYIYNKIKTCESMMTKENFLQLLKNTSERDKVFDDFLKKYRNTFNQIVSIRYSNEKYNAINIADIFYNNFLKYVVKELESSNKTMSVDEWVPILAKKRCNAIKDQVAKAYVKHCLEAGGCENWNNFNVEVREVFAQTIISIVRRQYNRPQCGGLHGEIERNLLQHLYMERAAKHNPLPKPIEDIDRYIYRMFNNLAVRKRKCILEELGLDPDLALHPNQAAEEKEFDWEDEALDFGKEQANDSDAEQEDNSDEAEGAVMVPLYSDDSDEDVECEEKAKRRIEAEKMIEYYLGKFPEKKKEEEELLRRVYLCKACDRVELAKEMGITLQDLDNNRIPRAMRTLISIALPDIKEKRECMFNMHKDSLADPYQVEILEKFFSDNKTVKELSKEYHKPLGEFKKDLISAFNKIKVIHTKKRSYITDKNIAKFEAQMIKEESERGAIYSLTQPGFKPRFRPIFLRHKDSLEDPYQRKILEEFLSTDKSIQELSKEHNKTQADFKKDLMRACKRVEAMDKKERHCATDKNIAKFEESEQGAICIKLNTNN